jgi:hypothetical protein
MKVFKNNKDEIILDFEGQNVEIQKEIIEDGITFEKLFSDKVTEITRANFAFLSQKPEEICGD